MPRPRPHTFDAGTSGRLLPGYAAPFIIRPCVIDGRAVFVDDYGERAIPLVAFDALGTLMLGVGLVLLALATVALPPYLASGIESLVLGVLGAVLSIVGIFLLKRGGQADSGGRSDSPSRRVRLLIIEPAQRRLVDAYIDRRPLSVLNVAEASFDDGGPFEGGLQWTYSVPESYRAIYARLRWETWMLAASSSETALQSFREQLQAIGVPVRSGRDLAGLGSGRTRYEPVRLRGPGPDRLVNSAELLPEPELRAVLAAVDRRLGRRKPLRPTPTASA